MGVKAILTAGLTALLVVGGGAWAYVHYTGIYGCPFSSCPSQSAYDDCPASAPSCCDSENVASDGAQPTAAKNCCDMPSRQSVIAKE